MRLINSDCIEAMKAMPENSVDSIVTDPPYELGFMGKSWDASGIAFNVDVWREALRVLKPGGHLIAFSGSRTYHRMAVAIEDAGFEIRDQIMWVYGSGFPKSHNVSKGIDKAAGVERELAAQGSTSCPDFPNPCSGHNQTGRYSATVHALPTLPNTDAAKQWDGWGTALKPAHEPMVLARKPLIGTVANNVLTYGTGGLNIDASRVEGEVPSVPMAEWTRSGTTGSSDKRSGEMSQPHSLGRFPANFIHDGSDEVVALFPEAGNKWKRNYGTEDYEGKQYEGGTFGGGGYNGANTYADSGSAARFFYCAKASKRDRNEGLDGFEAKRDHDGREDGNPGDSNPRNRTNDKKVNHHPTVKPTDLMRYLVRLVTPMGGVVLDPFMGSGSTGKACVYESFDFIGIDQSAEYVAIAQARIDFAQSDDE